jgi:hypothetical protein
VIEDEIQGQLLSTICAADMEINVHSNRNVPAPECVQDRNRKAYRTLCNSTYNFLAQPLLSPLRRFAAAG